MKRYKELFLLTGAIFVLASCSDSESKINEEVLGEVFELKSLNTTIGAMATGGSVQTRKIEDFAVNSELDPTASMTFRTNWELDVQIYKGGSPYPNGKATFVWESLAKVWEPNSPIYFPNYSKQFVSAKLYPPTWQDEVDQNQSTENYLLSQDILTQNGDNTVTVNPAHIPTIEMRHGHAMLDFILDNVDESHIANLKVELAGVTYTPYRVASSDKVEYLLIMPLGIANPEITLETKEGISYTERIAITNTQPNVAYCVHLKGLELSLSTISIADWTLGKALSGDYSSTTSYPTFQGEPSATYTLYYDNDLNQDITFNANGERTIKPLGRTLIKVERNGVFVDLKIVLRSMVIDLEPYFED